MVVCSSQLQRQQQNGNEKRKTFFVNETRLRVVIEPIERNDRPLDTYESQRRRVENRII